MVLLQSCNQSVVEDSLVVQAKYQASDQQIESKSSRSEGAARPEKQSDSKEMASSSHPFSTAGKSPSAKSPPKAKGYPNLPPIPGSPGRAEMPTSQVEIGISCRNLLDRDVFSKSDPMCILYLKDSWQDRYYEVGRTETIDDTLNPDFVRKFIINYNFEAVQRLKFEVWDVDPVLKVGDVELYDGGNDFLGRLETTLADLVAHQGRQFKAPLTGVPGKTDCGNIILVVEEVAETKQIINMQLAAKSLLKSRLFFKDDPFLVLSRSNEDGSWSVVHRTEFRRSTLSPRWNAIQIRARVLCNADPERAIKIECFDSRFNGDHKLIGTCYTNLNKLAAGVGPDNVYELIHPKKAKRRPNYKNSGVLELTAIHVGEEVTFLDYIRAGTQMHFAVAIDFTASNGDPRDPLSLHHIDYTGRPNAYEIALKAVGEILSHYDSEEMFAAYGFGAKIPPNFTVSHQFPLNMKPGHPYCKGVAEILQLYRAQLQTVTLYGPTNFAPVINNTAAIARNYENGKHYFVLLIITDGIISDMHATKTAIVSAAMLPLSIIIVGVGGADFSAMDELDGDDVRVAVNGRKAERDIVQFVPMHKFLSRDGPWIKSKVDLAREVLYEIPDQMTGYMKSKGFRPNGSAAGSPSHSSPTPSAPSFKSIAQRSYL